MPILPSGDYGSRPGISNSVSSTLPFDISKYNRVQRARISPFMPVEIIDEINDQLTSKIGSDKLRSDELLFIDSRPTTIKRTNPPLIQFAFVAPKDAVKLEKISVFLDGENISKDVTYSVVYQHERDACYHVGHYQPDDFLQGDFSHNIEVNINPEKTNSISRNESFVLDPVEDLCIETVEFLMDETTKTPIMDQLFVRMITPHNVNLRKRQYEHDNWQINYQDGSRLPSIQSIETPSGFGGNTVIIKFMTNVAENRKAIVVFQPLDGVKTRPFERNTPGLNPSKGGGAVRRAATTCSECTGHFLDVVYAPAIGCEYNSHFTINAQCPPKYDGAPDLHPCQHIFREMQKTLIFYEYYIEDPNDPEYTEALYYLQSENNTGTPNTETFCGSKDGSCYDLTNSIFSENYKHDYVGDWQMDVDIPPHNQEPYCYSIDQLGVSMNRSDSEKPVFTRCEITKEEIPDNPNPLCVSGCLDCKDKVKYYLEFTVTDEHCLALASETKFYIAYKDGRILDMSNVWEFTETSGNQLTEQVWKIFIDDPNIFQCADFIVIKHEDRTGNWDFAHIPEGGHPPDELPYPTSVEMDFGVRPPKKDGEDFYRQYVNLETHLVIPTPEVCNAIEFSPAENGDCLYIEVSVDPPVYGIEVYVKYEDPLFDPGINLAPTNMKIIGGSSEDYRSDNNPDLSNEHLYLLWGSHPAYGHDKVTYGDNWNYYPGTNDNIGEIKPPIPINDDPIIKYDDSRYSPHFKYTSMLGPHTSTPSIKLTTNKYGKAATWFYTGKHGGDNFRFKVFKKKWLNKWVPTDPITECIDCEEDCSNCERGEGNCDNCGAICAKCKKCDFCLEVVKSDVFTVCRKIKVWYGWMEDRGNTFPPSTCDNGEPKLDNNGEPNPDHVVQAEYKGAHYIGESSGKLFSFLNGVYDDCFIEIEREIPSNPIENTDYRLQFGSASELRDYADLQTGFDIDAEFDTVLLLGGDHFDEGGSDCANDELGVTVLPDPLGSKRYYSFVWSGNIFDKFHTPYLEFEPRIDNQYITKWEEITKYTAGHELGHNIYQDFPYNTIIDLHNCPHGLMAPAVEDEDWRSYHYAWHIHLFRTELSIFDRFDK